MVARYAHDITHNPKIYTKVGKKYEIARWQTKKYRCYILKRGKWSFCIQKNFENKFLPMKEIATVATLLRNDNYS
jgi:hypothetical protein